MGKRIAEAGGSMDIQSWPAFVLTVTLPRENSKNGEEE